MPDKSYVTLEQKQCLVCGIAFDSGALLLDTRLRNTFEYKTTTGYGLCPEHEKLHQDGFVALVECDPVKSGVHADTKQVMPEDAYRTGRIAHLRRSVFKDVFNVPLDDKTPLVFVEPDVIDKIQRMG